MSVTLTANGSIVFGTNQDSGTEGTPRYFIGGNANPLRNKIINGNMHIAQRNETATTTHPGGTTDTTQFHFVADRFRVGAYFPSGGNTNVLSYQRVITSGTSETPDGYDSYIRLTTLGSAFNIGANDWVMIRTGIEGPDIYDLYWGSSNAVPACLSFWARSSVTGNYNVALWSPSGGRIFSTSFYVAISNTWTKFYIPIPPCGDGTWSNAPGSGSLYIGWILAAGSNLKRASSLDHTWVSSVAVSSVYATSDNTSPFTAGPAGTTFDLTGVCFERAPYMNYSAHVMALNYAPSALGNIGSVIYSGDSDDAYYTVNLGFTTQFFGQSSSQIFFGTNGHLNFTTTNGAGSIYNLYTGPAVPYLGFFRGLNTGSGGGSTYDKRLKSLYGGSTTFTMEDGSSEPGYHMRAVMYNYSGSSAVETIIEFRIYQNYTYEGFNVIDVHYIQNNNGDIVLEANPGYAPSVGSPYARQVFPNSTAPKMFRVITKARTAVSGSDFTTAPGSFWGVGGYGFNHHELDVTTITNPIQYKLGVSSNPPIVDMKTQSICCHRYYEKLTHQDTVIPPSGNLGTRDGLYPYFRGNIATAQPYYIPYTFSEKAVTPTVTMFSESGVRGYLTINDGVNSHVVGSTTWLGTSAGMMYYNSSSISHYGLWAYTEVYAEIGI